MKKGTLVAYMPNHAQNNISHPDVEVGIVKSKNKKFIFVRYWCMYTKKYSSTAKATKPENLIKLKECIP